MIQKLLSSTITPLGAVLWAIAPLVLTVIFWTVIYLLLRESLHPGIPEAVVMYGNRKRVKRFVVIGKRIVRGNY